MEKEVKHLMNRLFSYISKKFWGPFFFALGVFAALVVLGDTFEKLKYLSEGAALSSILQYSLLSFPNWLATIVPVACLLAAISVVSEMVASGEWTACVAGGFAPRQLFKPVVICILIVAGLTMLVQEFVIPPLNIKANEILYTKIKLETNYRFNAESDVAIKLSPSQMLYAKWVDLEHGLMKDVSIDTYNDQWGIQSQIIAKQMVWDKESHQWICEDGTERTFVDKTTTQDTHFDLEPAPVNLSPKEMSVSRTDGKLMSLRELNRRIAFYKRTGLSSYVAESQRQYKLATPFVTLIMCLLGMPFAISMRRKSKILNIIASIVIAFIFWWLMSMITSMSENGYLNPYLAGWGPVILFSAVLFFEFKWMKL